MTISELPCLCLLYISNVEEREEGGTPEILGAIRLGLVFQLKGRLGSLEARLEYDVYANHC